MNHRWCRRAGRQEMGTKRDEAHGQNGADDQEILQDQHHSPRTNPGYIKI